MRAAPMVVTMGMALTVALSQGAGAKQVWNPAGRLVAGVDAGNTIALSDGRVVSLAIPGFVNWWPPTTQIWNPATNKWTKTASTPALPAIVQGAPVLLDDGRILVTGFCASSCGAGSNTEIYDPSNDNWSLPGQMTTGR